MDYKTFGNLLVNNRFLSPIWIDVASIIDEELNDKENKNEIIELLLIYFSLIDDGNTCVSLDKDIFTAKWLSKWNNIKIMLEDNRYFKLSEFEDIKEESIKDINYLDLINDNNLKEIIGFNKLFVISDNWLYARKYYEAVANINKKLDDIFYPLPMAISDKAFDYKKIVDDNFNLTKKQEEAVVKGFSRNLIITGGPGTGKTTSICFLLLGLLLNDLDYEVYLASPSGKASSRMKESILGGLKSLNDKAKEEYSDVIKKISNLDEYTIHRLLGYDNKTNGFIKGENNKFSDKSIFVVDEVSMADVSIFSSLISAIPRGARVFFLGDKNQLPSVDSGAVLSDLLKSPRLQDYIVALDESKRFTKESKIYALAEAINSGSTLPVEKKDWKSYREFEVSEVEKGNYPIYYYSDIDNNQNEKDIIEYIISKWVDKFYKDLPNVAMNLLVEEDYLNHLYEYANKSRILCAENEGLRGTTDINKFIIKNIIKDKKDFTPGEVVMITKNNKSLDLYNGETGLIVSFKGDETLYFMIEKNTKIVDNDGKHDNYIFKIGRFVFYPIRLIAKSDIDYAFAITIHKSQGSDYPQILVILPKREGHPLVNREIIYTAITRTKGNTYILSNQERLEEGKNRVITRDTNIK